MVSEEALEPGEQPEAKRVCVCNDGNGGSVTGGNESHHVWIS